MSKHYDVLYDTWLRGRQYASGSTAILGDEDAAGYIRAGLIKGDDVEPEEVQVEKPDTPVKPSKKAPKNG